jgi:hypothetical protein
MAAIILKDFFHSIFKRIHLENLLLLSSDFLYFFFPSFDLCVKMKSSKTEQQPKSFSFWTFFFVSFIVSLWCQKVHQFHHQNDVKSDESLINFFSFFWSTSLCSTVEPGKLNNNQKNWVRGRKKDPFLLYFSTVHHIDCGSSVVIFFLFPDTPPNLGGSVEEEATEKRKKVIMGNHHRLLLSWWNTHTIRKENKSPPKKFWLVFLSLSLSLSPY